MFEMLHTAGIYIQNKEQLKIYVKHYMDSCKHCDVLGVWRYVYSSKTFL